MRIRMRLQKLPSTSQRRSLVKSDRSVLCRIVRSSIPTDAGRPRLERRRLESHALPLDAPRVKDLSSPDERLLVQQGERTYRLDLIQ